MIDKDVIQASIVGYGYDGEGVARVDGKVVFVPFALKDEEVRVQIVEERTSFCRGIVTEVVEASGLRTVPPCPYFGRCGGCQYQHTTYQNELEIKKDLLSGQLKKVGFEGEISVVKSPSEYGYRNKIRLFVGEEGLCLKERASRVLCEIEKCLLVSERMNRAIEAINNFLKRQHLCQKYSEVIIRQEGESLAIVFVLRGRNSGVNYQGIYLIVGNCGIFESYNGKIEHKIGLKTLFCEEFGLKCNFSPTSFHQVNRFVGEKLYQFVLTKIRGKRVINCYSGAGVLSGAIAKKDKFVQGIELGESEHMDAEKLKSENDLFSLTNIRGDCAKVLKTIDQADTIIVDPPKKGMDGSVTELLNAKKCRLIYISCNSATLVRDLQRLSAYRIHSVTLFDMFSRTGEYEVVAILERV